MFEGLDLNHEWHVGNHAVIHDVQLRHRPLMHGPLHSIFSHSTSLAAELLHTLPWIRARHTRLCHHTWLQAGTASPFQSPCIQLFSFMLSPPIYTAPTEYPQFFWTCKCVFSLFHVVSVYPIILFLVVSANIYCPRITPQFSALNKNTIWRKVTNTWRKNMQVPFLSRFFWTLLNVLKKHSLIITRLRWTHTQLGPSTPVIRCFKLTCTYYGFILALTDLLWHTRTWLMTTTRTNNKINSNVYWETLTHDMLHIYAIATKVGNLGIGRPSKHDLRVVQTTVHQQLVHNWN
jgi:hypothetical protein